jgi:hypothetical protein
VSISPEDLRSFAHWHHHHASEVREFLWPDLAVGLMLGTRLWFSMWDADRDDDAAFERRLDSVVREIGDRGKLILAEAIPPEPTPEPTPAPAPAPAPAPRPVARAPALSTRVAPTPVASEDSRVLVPRHAPATPALNTVAMEQDTSSSVGGRSMTSSLGELSVFLQKQQRMQMEREEKLDAEHREAKAETAELRRELEKQRQELDAKIEQKLEAQRREAKAETSELRRELQKQLQEQQLVALQARLETLHGAKLLDDEALFLAEDAIADSEDVTADGRVSKLIALSRKMSSDRAFARQLQRKKWL